MENSNKKITISNVSEPNGVILENRFGEKGDIVFEGTIEDSKPKNVDDQLKEIFQEWGQIF